MGGEIRRISLGIMPPATSKGATEAMYAHLRIEEGGLASNIDPDLRVPVVSPSMRARGREWNDTKSSRQT
jgi:hypothetical protein